MRVLLGLAALAASANGQVTRVDTFSTVGAAAQTVPAGANAFFQSAKIQQNSYPSGPNCAVGIGSNPQCYVAAASVTPLNATPLVNGQYVVQIHYNAVSSVWFELNTNQYVGQFFYRSGAVTSAATWLCDSCSPSCDTNLEAITNPSYRCASTTRVYRYDNLAVGNNNFQIRLLDNLQMISYTFQLVKAPTPIIGDPQIYGMQGQDFQVHGIPDEIFNMITYPNLQVNARFSYLSSGLCIDNYTACFAHPGTYISEEGIRLGNDKIHVRAGSAKKGLSVSVNGKKLASGKQTVKLGHVELVNHRRVVIKSPVMTLQISNSDKFLNQETMLHDQKLLALGAERRVLADGESFHAEVPLHGLQGQTWRNAEYPSGLEYEGSISDYHVTDGNLFGSNFVFNKYAH